MAALSILLIVILYMMSQAMWLLTDILKTIQKDTNDIIREIQKK